MSADPADNVIRLLPGYFDQAWLNQEGLVRAACNRLRDVDFDSLVGTGLSGALVVPVLARALKKTFMIVRKTHDASHSRNLAEGILGRKWIFVDDFMASGKTRSRCLDTIAQVDRNHTSGCDCGACNSSPPPEGWVPWSTYAGSYFYTRPPLWLPEDPAAPIWPPVPVLSDTTLASLAAEKDRLRSVGAAARQYPDRRESQAPYGYLPVVTYRWARSA